jgi:penicillin-binding protein 1C
MPTTRNRWNRFLRRTLLTIVAVIVFAIIAFQAAVRLWTYPADEQLPPVASTWITDRSGNTIAAFAGGDGGWCRPLREEEISPHLFDAIVAVEDQRYYQHGGVDWASAASAAWQDLLALRYRRGASTLTMQLVHLRRPAPRSLWVKLTQAIRADQIERTASKRQILVEYLNRAPFGGNLNGAGAASWRYFSKPCKELSLGQAALLAGIPQSPVRFRPDRFPVSARSRREHVLQRMLACGMIDQRQFAQANNEPVDASWHPLPQDAPERIGLLPALVRLAHDSPGQVLRTTIDSSLQRAVTLAMENQLHDLSASNVTAGAAVVLDTASGQCLASVSRCTDRPNDAVDLDLTIRPRSSGSTLKPFIYAGAFDAGIATPSTVVDDSPVAFAGYEPGNYDRQFAGRMSAADALAQSRNVPALVMLSKLRVDRAIEVMHGCGLTGLAKTPDRYGLSLAIGGAETTPMELAEGYATLARGGLHRPAVMLTAVGSTQPDAGSEVIRSAGSTGATSGPSEYLRTGLGARAEAFDSISKRGAVLRASSCLQALQCIADPERTRRIYPPAVDIAPAWKTGTSSGHRDAWCCGVTPRRTVVVWLGNTDGSRSDALVGQDAAAPLALRIITLVDTAAGANFAPPPWFANFSAGKNVSGADTSLVILSPVNHQTILHDPALPASQQRLALRARFAGDGPIWWFVDGQCLGNCESDEILWWQPTPGSHEVRATTRDGKGANTTIRVQ